jgi:hypothetical protein
MDHEPLVKEQLDAAEKFLREFDKYAPVRVAFWLHENDKRYWDLYIVSDKITDENFDLAYGEVVRLRHEMPRNPYFPDSIRVLGVDDRLAQAALSKRQYYAGEYPIRLRDTYFGGKSAAEIYIYPVLTAAEVP